jgi:hypothetical protein
MSFDVFFFGVEEPPRAEETLQALIAEAVESVGGRLAGINQQDQNIEADDGSWFEWYGPRPADPVGKGEGGMAALGGLSIPTCRCLYAIAAKTDWVIMAAMEDSRPVRVKEARALPVPDEMGEALMVESPEELCEYLGGGFAAWSRYRDRIRDGSGWRSS